MDCVKDNMGKKELSDDITADREKWKKMTYHAKFLIPRKME